MVAGHAPVTHVDDDVRRPLPSMFRSVLDVCLSSGC